MGNCLRTGAVIGPCTDFFVTLSTTARYGNKDGNLTRQNLNPEQQEKLDRLDRALRGRLSCFRTH